LIHFYKRISYKPGCNVLNIEVHPEDSLGDAV